MTYYLNADGKWYGYDGRWQYLGNGRVEAPLEPILAHDSHVLAVCKLDAVETVLFYEAQKSLHLRPDFLWTMFRETEVKDGAAKR